MRLLIEITGNTTTVLDKMRVSNINLTDMFESMSLHEIGRSQSECPLKSLSAKTKILHLDLKDDMDAKEVLNQMVYRVVFTKFNVLGEIHVFGSKSDFLSRFGPKKGTFKSFFGQKGHY